MWSLFVGAQTEEITLLLNYPENNKNNKIMNVEERTTDTKIIKYKLFIS
jgi:hypothetical protein